MALINSVSLKNHSLEKFPRQGCAKLLEVCVMHMNVMSEERQKWDSFTWRGDDLI